MNKPNYVFLIGGYDLEMLEIINILKGEGLNFIDKKLSWGAKLSAYQDFFDSDGTFVGIELIEDIKTPQKYVAIDHHNERSGEPASIEQVAELLGIKLTYYQQIVAANDKGYIPAMRALKASEAEIQSIRRKDRAAQGVTEQDELWGEEAVSNLEWRKDVVVVYTKSDRFSPVTDRLEVDKLIVYNDHSLNYYGVNVNKLVEKYRNLIEEGKAYSGGGDMGFFGLVSGEFDEGELKDVVEEIVGVV